MYVPHGGHARHYKEQEQGEYRTYRFAKHRYIYFCTFNKRLKREWKDNLKYPIQPYPKGDNNKDYRLGEFINTTLIRVSDGQLFNASEIETEPLENENFKIEGW